ncbi:MAG TPA: lipoprotein [Pseudolabrys sp.]|nr:lipoprotein [Pseudolabrys sp.]
MSHSPDRLFIRLALIGAFAAAFALAGCGRKGPLDPPPSAVSATGQQEPANTGLIASPFERPGEKKQSSASKVPNKSFVLDPLLN